jgi:hypothetical protein
MTDPVDKWVDPSINANSGTGTEIDPYGDLQYALDSELSATNGMKFHIASGTTETLAAPLDIMTTYGGLGGDKPLFFVGDGGQAAIDCAGYTLFKEADKLLMDAITIENLRFHNGHATLPTVYLADFCVAYNCEFDDHPDSALEIRQSTIVADCYFHNIGAYGLKVGNNNSVAIGNYFKNDGTETMSHAIYVTGRSLILHNMISVDGATTGIELNGDYAQFINNSILSSSGSGYGIRAQNSDFLSNLSNNLIEGFSSSGTGIDVADWIGLKGQNSLYNNSTQTAYVEENGIELDEGDETLSNSPFDKSGSDTFANRATYFSPTNEGLVREGDFA